MRPFIQFIIAAAMLSIAATLPHGAQVNVAMVRYCFGSKDGLLDALLERVLHGLAGELERLLRSELAPSEQLRRHVAVGALVVAVVVVDATPAGSHERWSARARMRTSARATACLEGGVAAAPRRRGVGPCAT